MKRRPLADVISLILVLIVQLSFNRNVIGNNTQCNLPKSQLLSFLSFSLSAMTYQTQASQCATKVNDNISRVKIMALYCEYLSIFCSSLANLNSLVNFIKCVWEGPDFYNKTKNA